MILGKYIGYNDGGGFPAEVVNPVDQPYILASTIDPSKYEDITTIAAVDKYWGLTGRDYKVAREAIKALVATAGYDNLSASDKYLAAKWFACDMSLPLSDGTISFAQFTALGNDFNRNSKLARSARLTRAEAEVRCRLGITNGNTVIDEISAPVNLAFNYKEYGREGTESGDPEAIYDYIQATAGTSYEHTGLASKAWMPADGTALSSVITSIMDILKNGNY